MMYHKRIDKDARCAACRGTGLKWGWWTLLLALPIEMLAEIFFMAVPLLILVLLLLLGFSVYSNSFTVLYYAITLSLAAVAGWYVLHWAYPKCPACGGKGRIEGKV